MPSSSDDLARDLAAVRASAAPSTPLRDDLAADLAAVRGTSAPSGPPRTWGDTAADVATGFGKGAARTAIGLGELVHKIPGVTSAVDALYGTPGLSDQAFQQANAATQYTNMPQMVGGALETIAEMALPGAKAAQAVPRTARAGAAFQEVMSAAKNVPIDVNAPGQAALRIQQLAERGGSMPMVVRKFLNRITDPKSAAMTYEEARDFASNISRLSADEYGRLTPVIAKEVNELRFALNRSIMDAAQKAGKLSEYQSAMKEYANAMRLREFFSQAWKGIQRAAVPGGAAGLTYYGAQKLKEFFSGTD